MDASEVQLRNANSPIDVIPFPMVTEVRVVMDWIAWSPIAITGYPPNVEGIVMSPPVPVYLVMVA
jgi:hypothetical protein